MYFHHCACSGEGYKLDSGYMYLIEYDERYTCIYSLKMTTISRSCFKPNTNLNNYRQTAHVMVSGDSWHMQRSGSLESYQLSQKGIMLDCRCPLHTGWRFSHLSQYTVHTVHWRLQFFSDSDEDERKSPSEVNVTALLLNHKKDHICQKEPPTPTTSTGMIHLKRMASPNMTPFTLQFFLIWKKKQRSVGLLPSSIIPSHSRPDWNREKCWSGCPLLITSTWVMKRIVQC